MKTMMRQLELLSFVFLMIMISTSFAVDYEDSITLNFACAPYTSGTCGTEVVVESYGGFSAFLRQEHSVAYNPTTKESLIVYTKIIDPNNLSSKSIRAAVVSISGSLVVQPFDLVSYAAYNLSKAVPRAVYNGNGFVVAIEYGDFLSSDILLAILSSSYQIQSIQTLSKAGSQTSPSIYYNSASQQYALAYLSAPSIAPVYVGVTFFTLTGTTFNEIRSALIDVALPSNASPTSPSSSINAGLPVIQPTADVDSYLIAAECQTSSRTTVVLYQVSVSDGAWQLTDTINLAFGNSSLPSQTAPKFVYSASQNRYAIAVEAAIFPGLSTLERLQVFSGFVSSSGLFLNVNDTYRPFNDQQGAIISQPWVALSASQSRFLVTCKSSSQQGKQASGVGVGSITNATATTDVYSSAFFNIQTGSSSFPIANSFPSTTDSERMIIVWRELRLVPVTIIPESVLQSPVDNSGAIAAAVVVPILTICILVIVGIALWYRFWRPRFQFKPVSRGDIISLPPPPTDGILKNVFLINFFKIYFICLFVFFLFSDEMYDRDGKPMYAEDGRPLYDQEGNPLYDAQGKIT